MTSSLDYRRILVMATALATFGALLASDLLIHRLAAEEAARQADAIDEPPITEFDRDHWAFQPIVRPALPRVSQRAWPQTGVDHFVLSALERAKLAPSRPADRRTLLRRLKFDLVGLPPTPEELDAFVNDPHPAAYEEYVDRYLASPAYGERWAQHWLDLARFAETDGFEFDKVRREAWRYRQWVIEALNVDMSYRDFVTWQLTGDLSRHPEGGIATMFCLAGPDMPDVNEQDLRRHDKLNEITSTVGAVLLGLQLHCAQCHDHKYDPISQADFYRLRAIFEPSIPEMKRDEPVNELRDDASQVEARLYYRGELAGAGPVVPARPPRIASPRDDFTSFDQPSPRLAFVEWLFAEDNRLAARVIANRLWQYHFGRSLTGNPSDFGVIANGPSHPELLDWLACELRRSAWSLKSLHRTIVLSATYQQASRPAEDANDHAQGACAYVDWETASARDGKNELYWHFPRKRLEGEVIRDAMLAVSGQLNRDFGGPSVMPPLPNEMLATLLKGQWKESPRVADHYRRSVYVFARRNLRYPMFDVFDRPDAGQSCARRDESTTPLQSLQLLNSELGLSVAEHLRDRLLRERPLVDDERSPSATISRLFLLAFAREPTPHEQAYFQDLIRADEPNASERLRLACLAVLNANEFIFVD